MTLADLRTGYAGFPLLQPRGLALAAKRKALPKRSTRLRTAPAPVPADCKTQREQAVDLVFAGPEANWASPTR